MLAVVVVASDAGQDWGRLGEMLLGLTSLAGFAFLVVRPILAHLLIKRAGSSEMGMSVLAMLLIGTFASAYATKMLGVHPVFGAFLFGATLPRDDRLLASLIERVEHVAIIVLMPIFFALAGLSTTPSAFVGTGLGALLIVLFAAIAGKVLGGALGARIAGMPWRPALAVGSLMNARALMELIVMKVGLDAGVIGQELFTMLMVMAILTTVMTGPLLTLFAGRSQAGASETIARP
jgi:Kef-type K+ transport system membrane component KefB